MKHWRKKTGATLTPPPGVPDQGGLEQNLKWGYWAAAAAITKLPNGAPNWLRSRVEPYLLQRNFPSTRVAEARDMKYSGVGDAIQKNAVNRWKAEGSDQRLRLMEIEAELAADEGLGKCSAHCAIAFQFLNDEGVRPLDAMVAPSYFKSHTFVVIGRAKHSLEKQPTTWGQAAVICDPWLEVVCPVSNLGSLPYGGETGFYTDLRID